MSAGIPLAGVCAMKGSVTNVLFVPMKRTVKLYKNCLQYAIKPSLFTASLLEGSFIVEVVRGWTEGYRGW